MKKILIGLLVLVSIGANAAINLSCEYVPGPFPGDILIDPTPSGKGISYHLLLGGEMALNCLTHKGEEYSIYLSGIGPGLEFTAGRLFLTCPTVSKKRLDRKGEILLGAINVSATPGVGANVGVGLNHRGGACFLGGVQSGLGASVKIGGLFISTGHAYY
jgi:hypothetical protein